MKNVALVGVDTAGGTILGGGQSFFRVNGHLVAVLGDAVASHGKSPHNSATMTQATGHLKINGLPVVVSGDSASCGHGATGSGFLKT